MFFFVKIKNIKIYQEKAEDSIFFLSVIIFQPGQGRKDIPCLLRPQDILPNLSILLRGGSISPVPITRRSHRFFLTTQHKYCARRLVRNRTRSYRVRDRRATHSATGSLRIGDSFFTSQLLFQYYNYFFVSLEFGPTFNPFGKIPSIEKLKFLYV